MANIRIGPFFFRPKWLPTLAMFAMLTVTLLLGRWQLHRAQEKQERQQLYETRMRQAPVELSGDVVDADALRYRNLLVRGDFDLDRQILIDNREHASVFGYHVITPLRIRGTNRYVLVNRGWIARGPGYPRPPAVGVARGEQTVHGLGVIPSKRFLELSTQTVRGPVWQNLKLDEFRARSGLSLLPIVILQQDSASDGLVRVDEHPDTGIATHQGYAFQWFALSAALVVIYAAVNVKRTS
jgi:surfeit locus 1 family protein